MSATLQNKLEEIEKIIWDYAGIDGAHHKQWVFEQIILTILDNDPEKFEDWKGRYSTGVQFEDRYKLTEEDFEDADYEWEEGIAP